MNSRLLEIWIGVDQRSTGHELVARRRHAPHSARGPCVPDRAANLGEQWSLITDKLIPQPAWNKAGSEGDPDDLLSTRSDPY